jgi:3-deoxy-D-manno-octulosonic-acid transferase
VKYEFWYYFLKKIKYSNIPLLLISGIFWEKMTFFRWYAGWLRKMLHRFDHLFVQNTKSKELLNKIGLHDKITASGDTRFDRVVEIAGQFQPIPFIEAFKGTNKLIVAGSTWPEDEVVLQKAVSQVSMQGIKLILAPHEINPKHIESIRKLFPDAVLYSELTSGTANPVSSSCLVIDNIGMLSRLYQYAYITYVGGGLTRNGVHNVLEAAVYNKPVLFGPEYHRYNEAVGLVQSGGGISFTDLKQDGIVLGQLIEVLLKNEEDYKARSEAAGEFVRQNKGGTEKIMRYIQEKRLLTN